VINCSLIHEQILFKFAVNILQVTAWVTYFLCSRTARTRASARVRAGAWLKHSLIFGRILFNVAGHILHMTTSYMGYILIMFTHSRHRRQHIKSISMYSIVNVYEGTTHIYRYKYLPRHISILLLSQGSDFRLFLCKSCCLQTRTH
jgi:hypothetical protein